MGGKTSPEPLALSPDDHHVLQQLQQGLHDEIIHQYESYVTRRVVDTARWKHLRYDGELHAYREREDAPPAERSSLAVQPQAWMAARSTFPRVLVVGSVPGTLDDILYAESFHDTDSLRTNTMYEKAPDFDGAVLNILEGPSDDDPFRIASVTWFRRSFPILRDRSVLTYNDSRLSRLPNGDRIGVRVLHSIRHENFKYAARNVRVECSIATVFRQLDPARVEVYTIHFVDPKGSANDSIVLGDMANAFVVQETVKSLLAMIALADTALNKKLCYRLRQRVRQLLQRRRSETFTIDAPGEAPQQCEQCDKKLGGLFKSSGHTCQLCDKLVCGRCITKRELVIDATVVEKPFEFCDACIKQTQLMPAAEVARAELRERLEELEEKKRCEQKHAKLSPSCQSPTSAHDRMRASPLG